jgi:uncharacterized protein (DUF2147 family)
MKHVAVFLLAFAVVSLQAQSITGRWKTIDDESGEGRSIVEIFERDGKYFGKVIRIFTKPGEEPDPVCKECPKDDARYGKKVIGMEILRNMEKVNDYYDEGDILDPEIGKIYRCKVWVEGNTLKVRGFWGPFYRTQTWQQAD